MFALTLFTPFHSTQLLSKRNEDKGRRFVVQFFMEDDTIAIREPPIRNSGVIGGNFLRRQPMKHPDNRKFKPRDMYVGNIIEIACHKFLLLDADDFTYRLMENDEEDFPYSRFKAIYPRLAKKRAAIAGYVRRRASGSNTRRGPRGPSNTP